MGELADYFRSNTGRLISKWEHYFEVYERHFAPYRGRPVRVAEAGRRDEAIEKYRLAVEAAPEDAALRERARALESASR